MASEDHPLRLVCTAWHAKIMRALEFKRKEFQRHADEAMRFFDGAQGWLFEDKYGGGAMASENTFSEKPQFRMTVNRVSQLLQLMGPKLYPKNPYRSVSPRRYPFLSPYAYGHPADPATLEFVQALADEEQMRQAQAMDGATCLAEALNYTPNELDLAGHTRRVIDECLLKGMGVWWTEAHQPHQMSRKLIGSFQDSCDNIVFDPDAENYDTITWVARRCVLPTWEVEQRFGLKPGSLRKQGHYESVGRQANMTASGYDKYRAGAGKDHKDLLCYWEIYSKQGLGDKLPEIAAKKTLASDLSVFGDYCFLAVAENIPYPLNMPNELFGRSDDEVYDATQWPVPYWADGRWPFTLLSFHWNPNSIYPLSHIKPAIGELKFLSWAMSFLATKIKNACKTLVAIDKSAQDELTNKIFTDDGSGFSIVKFERVTGKSLADTIHLFNAPEVNADIWKIIESVNDEVARQLGIPDILYGESKTQSRSATDSHAKQSNVSIRIDDMYNATRGALTWLARNEAMASRWLYSFDDLLPILGPQCANYWMQRLVPMDLESLVREYEFRIEAGNSREPSKEVQVDQMNQSIQVLGPLLQAYSMNTGNFEPVNALVADWGKANDIDTSRYVMMNPLPPVAPPPAEAPQGEGVE